MPVEMDPPDIMPLKPEDVDEPITNVVPIHDHIFLQVVDPSAMLVVPPGIRPEPTYGIVIAMGPGRPTDFDGSIVPMPPIEVKDMVLFHGGAGLEFKIGGVTLRSIFPRDLIGVVR
jgi:co-chaperonin GroES (HSP10)